MRTLRKIKRPVTVRGCGSGTVPVYATFDDPRGLIESAQDVTRPLEVFVPKSGDRKIVRRWIDYRYLVIDVPRGVACSDKAVFESMRHIIPNSAYFVPETLLQLLPGVVDVGVPCGVDPLRRSHFLLQNSTAFVVWLPPSANSLVARTLSWREAFAECKDGDMVFIPA